jgi:hypothetical protein
MRKLSSNLRFIPVLLCSLGLVACEGTSNPELDIPDPTLDDLQVAINTQSENPFVGAWRMTSVVVGDDELLSGRDLLLIMTFWSDGRHSVSVSGDVDNLVCPVDTSCGWSGTYLYTGTTLTTVEPDHPDPGERGADTSFYAFCANKLIAMDEADDDAGFRFTLERHRRDCWATDCT